MDSAIASRLVRLQGGGISYAAISLSLLLHALLLVTYGGQQSAATEQLHPSEVRLSFLEPAPEPEVIPDVIPEPEPEKPEPKPEPKPVKKIKPESVRNVVEPQPVAAAPSATSPVAEPQIDSGLISRSRERYLASVLSHIEQFKWYPRAARKRGIEGDVTVRFMLHHDGSANNLVIENGPVLLMGAARRTIEKALPMPRAPAQVDCPIECKFRLSFHLNRP